MAEIKIEKKSTVWPWILIGLIVAALLLYFLVFRNNNEQAAAGAVMTDTSVGAATDTANATRAIAVHDAVADYLAYANTEHDMGRDHNYSSEALTMLANAVQAKANQVNVDLSADLDRAKQLADKIEKDPMDVTHANSIHQAAQILAGALQHLQEAKFPNLNSDVQSVKAAANNINPSVEVLKQKDAVKGFFDQSAALLQKM